MRQLGTVHSLQISNIFDALGVGCQYAPAWAKVEVVTGGEVYAYASVVDNRTGDAIFIPAQK